MASPSLTQFLSLPRWHSKWPFFPSTNELPLQHSLNRNRCVLVAFARRKVTEPLAQEVLNTDEIVVETKTPKRRPGRRKKVAEETPEEDTVSKLSGDVIDDETIKLSASDEDSKKPKRRTRKKAESTSSELVEEKIEKKTTRRRRTKKSTIEKIEDEEGSDMELSNKKDDPSTTQNMDDEFDLELGKEGDGGDDISDTYGWPPLVCCFGAAQHAFLPSGKQANKLTDYERQERMRDAFWVPEKFVRSPGTCASNVAVALASLGGKVAFMGKIGDDDYGQSLLYYLNTSNVQTRAVIIDGKRMTGTSQMKMGKRGGLKTTCVRQCAEDSLTKSEINIDVLKEAKMFYFNTFSLLERSMRSTTLRAIKISKKLGGLVFYDLNLPLPLWQSCEETKALIQEAWDLADIIEVTKQELEFLCGIKAFENFDTLDNDRFKFIHYSPDELSQVWHENLKVLFVTNGTSKIHYYTKEHNGSVLGMEDAPVSPFSCDMSASGDGIVAALMRMLTVQPHRILDKGYLEHSVKYAISCGVIDQWLTTRTRGFPPREGTEENFEPDPNGIRSLTEREYRTRQPVS